MYNKHILITITDCYTIIVTQLLLLKKLYMYYTHIYIKYLSVIVFVVFFFFSMRTI